MSDDERERNRKLLARDLLMACVGPTFTPTQELAKTCVAAARIVFPDELAERQRLQKGGPA